MPMKKQIFSIPNLLGYFRILLIPVIFWRYVTAQTMGDYYVAAMIIGISGITDFLDGYIARKFDMVTDLGKALDPIADKLTQAAIVLALCSHFPWMYVLAGVFVIKEGYMLIMGMISMKQGKMLGSARWYGKVCTATLYLVMFILILLPEIPMIIANVLIFICIFLLLYSFVNYIFVYHKLMKK